MGKIWELFAMRFYINTREAKHERPHVHVVRGRGRSNDMKIWLDTCTLASIRGEFGRDDVHDALLAAETFNKRFMAEWVRVHGRAVKRQKK